ncbi:glycosyl hydrolase [Lentzea sp. PSKA42]|uniref:Glycosyl hydrolase n=1 Tax=Lentzea indica TaxID=2604800 RepID=A0ABX1FTG7_9PSEU|nr:discoidin domain-containing protein [Lentzea indica]NKE61916.1 glycosyl hydrolase [Lentzea indica]
MSHELSRRVFLTANAGLLAGVALSPGASASQEKAAPAVTDLALNRPVSASSSAYAATPPQFVTDGLQQVGVRGSGWRAAGGDPQWVVVDLQAVCRVSSFVLVFEAKLGDPTFVPAPSYQPRTDTTGAEILSAAALSFRVDVSTDNHTWRDVYRTEDGMGAETRIVLDNPVDARWVRLVATRRSNDNPLGLNGFQIYGTSDKRRPDVKGWTDWRSSGKVPALKPGPDNTVELSSGWHLTMDDFAGTADGAALAKPGVDTAKWLDATVPGTVLTSLVDQGHFPDPVSGMHNMKIPEALSRHAWWYRRTFPLPKAFAGRKVWLELDGVMQHAEIWLNGTKIGDVTNPFIRGAFDITPALKASGDQVLALRLNPMAHPGSPTDKGSDGGAFPNSGKLYLDSPTYLSISGWDWMPAVRDRGTGIWDHIRLRATGDAVMGDTRVVTTLSNDHKSADIAISVPVRNTGTAPLPVTVQASFSGVKLAKAVTIAPGATTEVALGTHKMADPKLWWPNGYGDPYLHELVLSVVANGSESDTRTTHFGIREFQYEHELPIEFLPGQNAVTQTVDLGAQTAQHVRVQAQRRATGWGVSMWSLSIMDGETDLARGKVATASSFDNEWNKAPNVVDGDPGTRWASEYRDNEWIQVDLGAKVSFSKLVISWERAYALLYKVQVSDDGSTWRDVQTVSNAPKPLKIRVNGVPIFCRGGNWGFDELLRRMPAERMDNVIALHRDMNFTMIRNWIGSSNRDEFFAACDRHGILVWNDFWVVGYFPDDIPGYLDTARDTVTRYRHHPSIVVWCGANEASPPPNTDAGLRKIVAEQHTDVYYQSHSADGSVSGHGPYYWVEPAKYFDANTYDTYNFGFHTEIGMPTVPVAETMRNLVGSEVAWPIGDVWYAHDWCTNGNQRPQLYQAAIDARLGASTGLDEFCRKAQFVNYENMRAMFEAWNANLWDDASALLLWMSHPAWHSTVWQTYDYDMDVNGTYFGAKKACEPHHVQASLDTWQVTVLNHTTGILRGRVEATVYSLTGAVLSTQKADVEVGPSGKTGLFTVTPHESPLHLVRLRLLDGNRVLSENTYWRYRAPSDMQGLNSLGRTRISLDVGNTRRDGDRRKLTATVRNTGKVVAAMTRIGLRDRRSGDRVLPTTYSDNYLWLLPGETREITLSWHKRELTSEQPRVTVEAYNA